MAKPKTQSTQTIKPKLSFLKSGWIPGIIFIAVITTIALNQAGYITLPHFGFNVYEIKPEAKIGVPCAYNFEELIPLLPPESNNGPYTFYLGSGVGFPPMGLILGPDGMLKGTPTGTGGNFQVCVKDGGGRSVCRTYHLNVVSASNGGNNGSVQPGKCPATSCDTGSCCGSAGATSGGITPTVSGVLTRDYCECPSDTVYSGVTDTKAAGGPWKICDCK